MGTIVLKSSTSLRSNWWGTGRLMQGLRNVPNTVIRRTCSPSHPVSGQGLGPEYVGDLIMGAARDVLLGGQLWRFQLSDDRLDLVFSDARLADRVADNLDKYDLTESESLLFGTGVGIVTDLVTGPNGTLFVVSLSQGTIYEIARGAP